MVGFYSMQLDGKLTSFTCFPWYTVAYPDTKGSKSSALLPPYSRSLSSYETNFSQDLQFRIALRKIWRPSVHKFRRREKQEQDQSS